MKKNLAIIWNRLPSWLQQMAIYQMNAKYVLGTNIIITNQQQQVWLQKHRFWPKYPWGLPGGHLDRHETPQQAIVREIKEELSADVAIHSIIDIRQHYKRGLVVFFAGQFASPVGRIDDTEIIEARFFNVDNLPTDMHPEHRQLIVDHITSQEKNG